MAGEQELHNCVTKFMDYTCRCPMVNKYAGIAFLHRCVLKTIHGADNVDVFTTGSSVEFYIQPLLSCVDDMDTMYSFNDSIAVFTGKVPLELPARIHDTIRVYEVVDSTQLGYVYLCPSYAMNRDNGRFILVNDNNIENLKVGAFRRYLPRIQSTEFNVLNMISSETNERTENGTSHVVPADVSAMASHGPATQVKLRYVPTTRNKFKLEALHANVITHHDAVPCIRCADWPVQAKEWLRRYREHGWPDSATINVIYSNGCDVVPAVHPLCRQDAWMSKYQWRLSFSRAEVTLLNSWTPVQQIVYHMLRFAIKKQIVSKHNNKHPDVPTLSGYHIKTLMLWACERKPHCWWSATSVIRLCSLLINELCQWVVNIHCRHYFIADCNLINHFTDSSVRISSDLKTLSADLLHWFLNNYIHKCPEECPIEVAVLFTDIGNNQRLQKAVNKFDERKLITLQLVLYLAHTTFRERMLLCSFQLPRTSPLHIDLKVLAMEQNHVEELCLRNFIVAVASLHVSLKVSIISLNYELLEMLCAIFEPSVAVSNGLGIFDAMMKAKDLARTSVACRKSTEKLHFEMAKAFLHVSLRHEENSELTSADCMAHVLLALLYCKTGHYRTAVEHCNKVLSHHDFVDCRFHRIEAEYLLSINASIDITVGLMIFYQHVLENIVKPSEQSHHDRLKFNIELLAHYFHTRCSMVAEKRDKLSALRIYQRTKYHKCLVHTEQLLVSDILLYKIVELQLNNAETARVDGGNCISSVSNSTSLVYLLKQVALENLVDHRQSMVREQQSLPHVFTIINEFELLRLYNNNMFEECLSMCQNSLDICLYGRSPRVFVRMYILAFPELLSLLDGDLVSLFGIIRLLHPNLLTLLLSFTDFSFITTQTLSLYLLVECQKKLRMDSRLSDSLRLIHFKYREVSSGTTALNRLAIQLIYRSLRLCVEAQ